jgi:hypothetical protein
VGEWLVRGEVQEGWSKKIAWVPLFRPDQRRRRQYFKEPFHHGHRDSRNIPHVALLVKRP